MIGIFDRKALAKRIHLITEYGPDTCDQIALIIDANMDLLTQNWPKISEALNDAEKGKLAVANTSTLDQSGPKFQIDTKLAFSTRFSDEREDYLEDPAQRTFDDLEDEKKAKRKKAKKAKPKKSKPKQLNKPPKKLPPPQKKLPAPIDV